MEIIITANSPGEIAGWTAPIVRVLKDLEPSVKITVLLLPCAFASGREEQAARNVAGVDRVLPVADTIRLILLGKSPGFDRNTVLLHLGGDLFYPVLIKMRIKCRLWSYEWAQTKWDRHFEGYFARDQKNVDILLQRKIPGEKIHRVGDLLVDSIEFRRKNAPKLPPHEGLTVTFMPGSRIREALGLLPLFAATAELLDACFPSMRFLAPVSPFINRQDLIEKSPFKPKENLPGVPVGFDGKSFRTGKIRMDAVDDSFSAINASDFMITIPGTSTGEAGAVGMPHLCVVPLNRPEDIPWVGIVGMLDLIPFFGKPLKRRLMLKISKTIGLVSQPNLRAGRLVAPEVMQYFTPENLFEAVKPYLEKEEKREQIREELLKVYGPLSGAAGKMAEKLLKG